MKHLLPLFLLSALVLAAGTPDGTAEQALKSMSSGSVGFRAENGMYYHRAELEHISAGPLTEERIVKVSKSNRKQGADPVPAIAAFSSELQKRGIRLILVPVPPKSAVYPFGGMKEGIPYLRELYRRLEAKGVTVLDLYPLFLQEKQRGKQVYCLTDSHWAPEGILSAARTTALEIGKLPGNKTVFPVSETGIAISGDLLPKKSAAKEKLVLRTVQGNVFSETSPVLVLGDSHTLVFSAKEDNMFADRSGFCELLAAELGHPVERMSTLGSASVTPRVQLFRKASADPAWLKGKKAVVWCFAAREFTESANGWITVPVSRQEN